MVDSGKGDARFRSTIFWLSYIHEVSIFCGEAPLDGCIDVEDCRHKSILSFKKMNKESSSVVLKDLSYHVTSVLELI